MFPSDRGRGIGQMEELKVPSEAREARSAEGCGLGEHRSPSALESLGTGYAPRKMSKNQLSVNCLEEKRDMLDVSCTLQKTSSLTML